MKSSGQEPNRRILIVDDNPSIHDDFRKILIDDVGTATTIDQEAEALLGVSIPASQHHGFELDGALQCDEAVAKVRAGAADNRPYAVAFVDMRMPPGQNGLATIQQLWQLSPEMEMVICTAYSDHSWREIQEELGSSDRLLILKKPFDKMEVQQLALALTEKWNLQRQARSHTEGLDELLRSRTLEIERASRSKSELFTNISHELLTPLNGMLGVAGVLETTSLNPEQHEMVAEIQRTGARLLKLLEAVLKLKALESGRLKL